VLELVGMIQKFLHCEHLQPCISNDARGEIRSQYLSVAKARELLGWRPRFSLEAGLRDTIRWYREFLAAGDHLLQDAPRVTAQRRNA